MMVTAGLSTGAVSVLASVARIALSPTDSGADSGAKLGDVALRRRAAFGAEAGLGQLGELFGLAHEPGELAGRGDLFLRQPVAGQQDRRIVGDRGRPRRQPRRHDVLRVRQRGGPLEQLLLGGDDRVHRCCGAGRRPAVRPLRSTPCCRPAWAGRPPASSPRRSPNSAGLRAGADAAATASAAR